MTSLTRAQGTHPVEKDLQYTASNYSTEMKMVNVTKAMLNPSLWIVGQSTRPQRRIASRINTLAVIFLMLGMAMATNAIKVTDTRTEFVLQHMGQTYASIGYVNLQLNVNTTLMMSQANETINHMQQAVQKWEEIKDKTKEHKRKKEVESIWKMMQSFLDTAKFSVR